MTENLSSSILLLSADTEIRSLLRAQLDLIGLWGRIIEVETVAIAQELTATQQPLLCIWHISDDKFNHEIFIKCKEQFGYHLIVLGAERYVSLFFDERFIPSPHTFRDLQDQIRATILTQHASNALLDKAKMDSEDQERIYRDLFNRGSDANLLIDYNTHIIIAANQRALEMYGVTYDEIIGMNMLELVDDLEHISIWHNTRFVKNSEGESILVERIHKKKDGTLMNVSVSASLFEFAGRMVFQDIIRDETERKLAEEREIELRIEQEQVKALRQFISDATHDLMTPITIIKTSLYLAGKSQNEEKRNQKLEVIGNQVERLQHMVEDIMIVAKLEAMTPNNLVIARVDLNNMIQTQVENYQPTLQKHKRTLTAHLPTVGTYLSVDIEYIQLAIANLLDNAIQYTSNEGHIDISVEVDDEFLYLSVSDDGIGIKEADQSRIFERFYRTEESRPSNGGFGLGLTIVKSIVELHYGDIEVISEKGVGSTFKIVLPRSSLTR